MFCKGDKRFITVIVSCFSLKRNSRAILSTKINDNKDNNLSCLHGIRFINMFFLIAYHSQFRFSSKMYNFATAMEVDIMRIPYIISKFTFTLFIVLSECWSLGGPIFDQRFDICWAIFRDERTLGLHVDVTSVGQEQRIVQHLAILFPSILEVDSIVRGDYCFHRFHFALHWNRTRLALREEDEWSHS